MSEPRKNPSHEAQGLALFTDAFREQPNVRGLWGVVARQIQDFETALFEVLTKRLLTWALGSVVPYEDGSAGGVALEDAEASQLDTLGALVGQAREGRGDPAYAAAIRLRVLANRSNGLANDMLRIAKVANPGPPAEFTYAESYPASFQISVVPITDATEASKFLQIAKPAGVAFDLLYSTDTTGQTIIWADDISGEIQVGLADDILPDTITNLAGDVIHS